MRQPTRPTPAKHKPDGLATYPARQAREVVAMRRALPACIRMPATVLLNFALHAVLEVFQCGNCGQIVGECGCSFGSTSDEALRSVRCLR